MAKFADSLITHGLIFLGLVLMATPLALWVAWTETIFLAVLATGAAALGIDVSSNETWRYGISGLRMAGDGV